MFIYHFWKSEFWEIHLNSILETHFMKKYIIGLSLAVTMLVSSAFVSNHDRIFEITKNIEIFATLYKEVNTHYVDQLDPSKLMKIGIDAMLKSLDPYTNYFSENQIERYKYLTEGKFDGIGASVAKVDGEITIIKLHENFGAHKAGLIPGDQIKAVSGESTSGKTTEEVRHILQGAGSMIDFSIFSPLTGETRAVSVERSEVNMENVPYAEIIRDDVGYINLTTFTAGASKNIGGAMSRFKKENPNLKGIIIDLRNNGGGLLGEAVNISNLFIDKGIEVVTTKGKVRENDNSYSTRGMPMDKDIPLTILVNDKSASASEIVSGVIQDLDRGVVIGQRTFGKGLVQNFRQLGFNNNLKITTAKYYIPSGRCVQSKEYKNGNPYNIPDSLRAKFYTKNGREVLGGGGVTPDIVLKEGGEKELLEALRKQFIIFKYVNEYYANHKTLDDPEQFTFTDFEGFKQFVKKSNFAFETKDERLMTKLIDKTNDEVLKGKLVSLRNELANAKQTELDRHKDKVIKSVQEEIVSRYHFQKGMVMNKLQHDEAIDQAVAIMKDESKYNRLLSK